MHFRIVSLSVVTTRSCLPKDYLIEESHKDHRKLINDMVNDNDDFVTHPRVDARMVWMLCMLYIIVDIAIIVIK